MAVLKLIKDGHGRWTPYFKALNHLEIAVSQLYMALDSVRKYAKHNFFTTGDGSFEECLNNIYNASKHQIAGSELPVWFSDRGNACAESELLFTEIEDFMEKMAGVVQGLCNREIAMQAVKS